MQNTIAELEARVREWVWQAAEHGWSFYRIAERAGIGKDTMRLFIREYRPLAREPLEKLEALLPPEGHTSPVEHLGPRPRGRGRLKGWNQKERENGA